MLETTTISLPYADRFRAWIVCFSASLFFFYEFIQMSMFNAVHLQLMVDFHANATQLGMLSSAYFYANILFMFPAGILLDRYSTRRIILIALGICVIGTLAFAFAKTLSFAGFCRFLTGIGGSFPLLCCLRLASRWFPPRRLALVSGLFVTVAMLGGITAQEPLRWLTAHYGWRQAIRLDAILGILIIGLIALCVEDSPSPCQAKSSNSTTALTLSIWQMIYLAMKNAQNWLFGLYTCMLNLPIFLLGQLWGSLYLTQARQLDSHQAAYVTSAIFLGTIIGSPFMGWLSDKLGLRKLPMLIAALIALLMIAYLIYSPQLSLATLFSLFLALGFITSSQVISYPAIAESNPHALAGTALGLASVLIMTGGAIFEPLVGWLMDKHWQGQISQGMHLYSSSDFQVGFTLLPLAFIVGAVMVSLAKETFCMHHRS